MEYRALTCPFYEELDEILRTKAAFSPPVLLESGGPSVTMPLDSEEQDDGFSKIQKYSMTEV